MSGSISLNGISSIHIALSHMFAFISFLSLCHKRLKQTAKKALINAYNTYVCNSFNSRDEPSQSMMRLMIKQRRQLITDMKISAALFSYLTDCYVFFNYLYIAYRSEPMYNLWGDFNFKKLSDHCTSETRNNC